MYPGSDTQADLASRLAMVQEIIDFHLRDEKYMAYPVDCDFNNGVSNSFQDWCDSLLEQFSGMDLDKCLQEVPLDDFLRVPLEAILQRQSALCDEYVNTCF